MVWGGSLNKEGSYYIRKLREADKVITFLEKTIEDLNPEEQASFLSVFEITMSFKQNHTFILL